MLSAVRFLLCVIRFPLHVIRCQLSHYFMRIGF
jgi:hypothetical protein